jgi:hypothetical protein
LGLGDVIQFVRYTPVEKACLDVGR